MLVIKVVGVIAALLVWLVIEALFQIRWPSQNMTRIVLGNLCAVTLLCLSWHGLSWTFLAELIFLTSLGVAFRYTIEYVNESFGYTKRGTCVAYLAGHLAALAIVLLWYVFTLLMRVILT